jgi:hypothetical protein
MVLEVCCKIDSVVSPGGECGAQQAQDVDDSEVPQRWQQH